MFECAQAYPECNTPSGNDWVRLRVTDLKAQKVSDRKEKDNTETPSSP